MLYNRRSRSSALFILLTSTTAHALYIPRSNIITTTTTTTTTTTSKTTLIWLGSDQNQGFDSPDENTATLPFTCFKCPMILPKLLHEIRVYAPTDQNGALLNDPEPRALVCEYDTNESPCRYDPATGTLLTDQPSGDSCLRSSSVSPECAPTAPNVPGGGDKSETNTISPLALSGEESEHSRRLQDSFLSSERADILEAILTPARPDSQYHFSALEAPLRYSGLVDDYDPLNLDPNPPPPTSPPSLDESFSFPSPLDFGLGLNNPPDEEKDHGINFVSEIPPTEPPVASHDHERNYSDLLLDLEFEDYSDVLRLNMK